MVNAETKKGNIPYRVSDTECECLSIARKTDMQKIITHAVATAPSIDLGI